MMQFSPQIVYDNLNMLERVDIATSAFYRQLAQDALGDPEVSLAWQQAIADRLNQANYRLGKVTVIENDSY
jgi:hypothetical protein